jgi:hypothetical protein
LSYFERREGRMSERIIDVDFKSDLLEQLKDPHYAKGYLAAALEEGAEAYALAREDVKEAMGLQRSSPLSKEPLVEVGNSIGESVPATIDQHTVLMAEKLAQPPCTLTAPRMVIEREPEAFLGASSVKSREEFCGANVEKTISGGHDVEPPSEEVTRYLSQYLIPNVVEIESAMRDEVMARKKKVSEALSSPGDHRILDAIFDERAATITEFAYRIFAVVK